MIVRTLLWRAGMANRLRAGRDDRARQRVLVELRGVRLRRLGVKGFRAEALPDRRGPRREDRADAGLPEPRGSDGRRGATALSRVPAAAFFDLDRTLLRRSSALALAGSFRERGLISRRQLAAAAAWQLLFVARGASHEAVRRAAEDGLRLLAGYQAGGAARARRGGDGARAPAARLCRAAAPGGAPSRARRARLRRLGDAAGDRRGDRRRPRLRRRARDDLRGAGRPLHGPCRCARCMPRPRPSACGRSPSARASTSRSARRTPTVTPTFPSSRPSATRSRSIRIGRCGGSRRIVAGPCSSSAGARTRTRADAFLQRLSGAGARGRGGRSRHEVPWTLTRALRRLRALGFGEADADELWAHFDGAERRGKQGHGYARIPWLEGLEGYDPSAEPSLLEEVRRLPALARRRRDRLPRARACRARAARAPAGAGAARRLRADVPDRDARPPRAPARRRRARRAADRDLAAAARPSRRRAEARRHEPARDRDPERRRRSRGRRRLDGSRDLGRRRRRARRGRRARPVRRRARPQGVRARSRAAAARRFARAGARATARCCSSRGRKRTRCRRYASSPAGVRLPGDS